MKTLEQIKEAYAKEVGAKNWELFINDQPNYMVEPIMDKIAIRYAQQACEDLRERISEGAKMKLKDNCIDLTTYDEWYELDKQSILNTEIILP